MSMGFIAMCTFACIIARCIIFKKREINWWKALIPGYNKYIFGNTICNKPKLGLLMSLLQPMLSIIFFLTFSFELWIMKTYTTQVLVPVNANLDSKVYVSMPDNISTLAIVSKYVLIAFALATIIVWCMMMWNFIKIQKRSPWWILLWAVIPVIPYCAFAISNEVVINKKKYILKKVEVNEFRKS